MAKIPQSFKRSLEARLDRLTPREAAALWLIYSHEAHAKKKRVASYGPIVKLTTRFYQTKVDAEGDPARVAFDSLITLADLAREYGQKHLWRLMYRATKLIDAVDLIYSVDLLKEVAHMVTAVLLPNLPKPVTADEWNYLVEWDQEDSLAQVEAFARHLTDAELEAEGFSQNKEDGGWVGIPAAQLEARRQKHRDRLVGLVKAGEFTGGLAVWPKGWPAPTLIVDGKIPGLAALRAFWPIWLRDHDFFISNTPTIDEYTVAGWREIYAPMSRLSPEEMLTAVDRFFGDAKKKDWGRGLARPTGLLTASLASLIMQVETPLLLTVGDVVGLVEWEVFRKAHEDFDEEPVWVVRIGDLRANARTLGLDPSRFDDLAHVFGRYYPDPEAREARASIGSLVGMLSSINFHNSPAFTYGDRRPAAAKHMGIEFVTPLEDVIKKLGGIFGEVATYKAVLQTIADEYFAGLQLIDDDGAADLKAIEDDLAGAEGRIADIVDRLKDWPWEIEDTSALQLKKAGIDEGEVRSEAHGLTDKVGGLRLVADQLGDPLPNAFKAKRAAAAKPEETENEE